MINSTKVVVSRYLTEDAYKLLKYGYFAVFKRPGLTSAEELEKLKEAIVNGIDADQDLKEEKYLLRAGHGGNLDNMATGVLAVGLCDGCKILPSLLSSDKKYTVTAQMGVATDTYNNMGNIVTESAYDHVTRPMLEEALTEFIGEIWQKPPAYSALKIGGQRASDIVRSGKELNLFPRPVTCHAASCVAFEPPYFTLEVFCGHGFYIRSLVQDLTEAVGSCGHVTALTRTKHGPFTIQDCLQPEHYNLDNIVSAIMEARKKFPELAQNLDDYWKNKQQEIEQQQQKKEGNYQKKIRDSQYYKQLRVGQHDNETEGGQYYTQNGSHYRKQARDGHHHSQTDDQYHKQMDSYYYKQMRDGQHHNETESGQYHKHIDGHYHKQSQNGQYHNQIEDGHYHNQRVDGKYPKQKGSHYRNQVRYGQHHNQTEDHKQMGSYFYKQMRDGQHYSVTEGGQYYKQMVSHYRKQVSDGQHHNQTEDDKYHKQMDSCFYKQKSDAQHHNEKEGGHYHKQMGNRYREQMRDSQDEDGL